MSSPRIALLAALSISACRPAPAPPPVVAPDASEAVAAADGGDAADAGRAPQLLPARIGAQVGGERFALTPEGVNESVSPDSAFEVELPFRIRDVRVRLFDESDKAVPSADRLRVEADATHYLLTPAEPLVPGSKYVLVVDGQQSELATDPAGNVYDILRVRLVTSGEKPAPQKPARKKRRH